MKIKFILRMMKVIYLPNFKLNEERQKELEKTQQKEEQIKEKQKLEPNRKVYASGVGKFINPNVKKDAR